jgi:predicted dehydrogenase
VSTDRTSRRRFLRSSAAAAATAAGVPYFLSSRRSLAAEFRSPNDRPVVGCIGTGDRWKAIGPQAMRFGDCVAVCDVDADHAGAAKKIVTETQEKNARPQEVAVFEDYRKLLDRKDIEVVTIVTPDHWHSKIAIEAMQAGKDIYCEKPLTLTIDEGKQIVKVLDKTKRVFQVGTQQRSEMGEKFLKAVAMVRDGRIGKLQKVTCAIGGAPSSGELPKVDVPTGLNWEMWLGQTPLVDYVSSEKPEKGYPQSRCHYEFRWWYEYSGGKMTDWGAHHVDIAQWAAGMENSGPVSIEGTATHPVPFKNGMPTVSNMYNAATKFLVTCKFPNGVELEIRHDTENGITFEGTEGKFFVSRGDLKGEPVDALKDKPLSEEFYSKLFKGKQPGNHMANFFDCLKTREQPISDVYTHHRAMTTCHLANIAIRVGRPLKWDPEKEQIVGDDEARRMQSREQRKGYEIRV